MRSLRWFAVSMLVVHLSAVASAQTGSTGSTGSPASAQAPTDPQIRIETLPSGTSNTDQRIHDVELKLHLLEEKRREGQETAADAKSADKGFEKSPDKGVALAYGPEGVGIVSADGKFQFRLRPLVQIDARLFLDDGITTFFVRRAKPVMEGTAFEYFDWRLAPELAGTPNIQDAYVNIRLFREIQLRAGKFKSPVGLERLMSDADLPFLERGLPTNLVPDRDTGVELHGDVLGGTLVYAGGIFNGAADGVDNNFDNNDKKDLVGRIMLRPFQPTFLTVLRKLAFGIAATRGTQVGALPPYRTPVQTTFFQYSDGVTAGGTHRRIAPQAYFYFGPFGMFAEYTRSTLIAVRPGMSARLSYDAWQVVASFFVTGEEASPTTVTPKHALNPRNFGVGAVELVARYGELHIDDEAFRLNLADPTQSARLAVDWGLGVNWHMARNFKLMIDFEHTSFAGGSPSGDRQSQILFLTRLQAAY